MLYLSDFSDLVTIRFFCIEKNERVSFFAPGKTGPNPSTLPNPPNFWIAKNVTNIVDLQSDSSSSESDSSQSDDDEQDED